MRAIPESSPNSYCCTPIDPAKSEATQCIQHLLHNSCHLSNLFSNIPLNPVLFARLAIDVDQGEQSGHYCGMNCVSASVSLCTSGTARIKELVCVCVCNVADPSCNIQLIGMTG